MTTQNAIIAAALIIALSIIAGHFMSPYQISATRNAEGNLFVWRVNTLSGTLELCRMVVGSSRKIEPACN